MKKQLFIMGEKEQLRVKEELAKQTPEEKQK